MMFYSDDPIKDFERHDAEMAKYWAKRPACDCCGEKIAEEFYYEIEDVKLCEDCIERFRKWVVVE